MNLKINEHVDTAFAYYEISGEVDMYSSPLVRKAIMNAANKQVQLILVNLDNVNYMDSSGVATLIEGLQYSKKYGGKIVLAGLQESVRQVFELTKLDKIFTIYNDINTAKKELDLPL
ncbi:MAG: STAS domain-containing protein [candidate division KSB1 bacterium]|nr:STAS domain-containing protein [candidate division KSB1 bacterium]